MFSKKPKNNKPDRFNNQHSDQSGSHQPTHSTFTTISSSSSSFYDTNNRPHLPDTNRSEKMVSDLRHLHLRVAHSKCKHDKELVQSLRDVHDEQFAVIRSLQRKINECSLELEEEINVINVECTDDEEQVPSLLERYPVAMSYYCEKTTKRFESSKKQCRDKFEIEKRQMIDENNKRYNEMKIKYGLDFKNMIGHLEKDSLRLAKMRLDFDKEP